MAWSIVDGVAIAQSLPKAIAFVPKMAASVGKVSWEMLPMVNGKICWGMTDCWGNVIYNKLLLGESQLFKNMVMSHEAGHAMLRAPQSLWRTRVVALGIISEGTQFVRALEETIVHTGATGNLFKGLAHGMSGARNVTKFGILRQGAQYIWSVSRAAGNAYKFSSGN